MLKIGCNRERLHVHRHSFIYLIVGIYTRITSYISWIKKHVKDGHCLTDHNRTALPRALPKTLKQQIKKSQSKKENWCLDY